MNTRKHGITMTAALIAAGTLGLAASTASADPEVFDVFITTGPNPITENIDFPGHQFGTSQTSDTFFSITITSGPSDRIGWDFEIEIDYALYDIGFFDQGSTSFVELLNIKSPGSPFPIDNARAKDSQGNEIGTIDFDGGNIFWTGDTQEILNSGEVVTIQWTQIPTPGAVALFGLAGLAAARRRR